MKKKSPSLDRAMIINRPKPVEPGLADTQTLARICTWREWESGRAARRALALSITGGKFLRRRAGKPRNDILLRHLNRGERGLPVRSF